MKYVKVAGSICRGEADGQMFPLTDEELDKAVEILNRKDPPQRVIRETLHEAIVELFIISGLGKPALALCYTLPPDYQEVHWITNIARKQSINLFNAAALKIGAQMN